MAEIISEIGGGFLTQRRRDAEESQDCVRLSGLFSPRLRVSGSKFCNFKGAAA
jgi:hypothetical protein